MVDLQKQKEETKRVRTEEVQKLAAENAEKRKTLKESISSKKEELLIRKQQERDLLRIEINVSTHFSKTKKP